MTRFTMTQRFSAFQDLSSSPVSYLLPYQCHYYDILTAEFIKPICLPLYEEVRQSIWDKGRQNQKVTGWGIYEQNVLSDVPREGDVTRLSLDQCSMGRNILLIGNQLCVSAFQKDSCQGDSGGPLLYPYLYRGQQRFVQTGIVSKGPKYCGLGSSAIYTDITRFVPWITQNIKSQLGQDILDLQCFTFHFDS